MTYSFHPYPNSNTQYSPVLQQGISKQTQIVQEQYTSSQEQCSLFQDWCNEDSGIQSTSQNSMEEQTCRNQNYQNQVPKHRQVYSEWENCQLQANITYRSILSGEVFEMPQDFLSTFIWRNNIADHSDPRTRQNILFYQMLMRMKEQEIAYIDSNMELKPNTGIALGYYNNTRGLFSYKQRKRGDKFIRIPKKQLIDVNYSDDSEMLLNIKTEKRWLEATQIVKRIIYLFQRVFIKRQYKQQLCKFFRQKFNDSFQRGKQSANHYSQQYQTFYENSFVQEALSNQIQTLYIELLPKSYDDLPSIDDYFTSCFENDLDIIQKKRIKKANIKELFLTIDNLIKKQTLFKYWRNNYRTTDAFRFHSNFIKYFKEECITWCYNVIATRSFSVMLQNPCNQDLTFLAPAIDLINHSNTPNCEWGYDAATESFYVQTTEYIGAGEEFTIRYGNLSNLNLLMNYGMCIEENQQESSITIYPDFQSTTFTKNLELAHITQKQLLLCFPWLQNVKEVSRYRNQKRRKRNCFSLCLFSQKMEDSLEKNMRKTIQQFRNFLSLQNMNDQLKKEQMSMRVIQQKRAYVIYCLLKFLKCEVIQTMNLKALNMNRLQCNDPQGLSKRVNYIILLDQQLRSCNRIIDFIQHLKKDKIFRLTQLLKLQQQSYYQSYK